MLLAVAGAALASQWMQDESIPAAPSLTQLAAHPSCCTACSISIRCRPALWYVAIDFQFFALMALLLWAGRLRRPRAGDLLVSRWPSSRCSGSTAKPDWDNWGIYFFGSYGLGAAAWWAVQRERPAAWLGVVAGVGIVALLVDFRLRIALALATALASVPPAAAACSNAGRTTHCSPGSARFPSRSSSCTSRSACSPTAST